MTTLTELRIKKPDPNAPRKSLIPCYKEEPHAWVPRTLTSCEEGEAFRREEVIMCDNCMSSIPMKVLMLATRAIDTLSDYRAHVHVWGNTLKPLVPPRTEYQANDVLIYCHECDTTMPFDEWVERYPEILS